MSTVRLAHSQVLLHACQTSKTKSKTKDVRLDIGCA